MKKIEIHSEAVEKIKKFTINDQNLGFGKYMAPIMIMSEFKNGAWGKTSLVPYGPLQLDPCAKVLHYAQEIFEGLKAYRHPDGQIALFRPELNARRFNFSARRMAMPEVPEETFVEACETIAAYCRNIVPKRIGESLYLRPYMIASEAGLGIKPAKEFIFGIVASPSGNYFASNSVKVFVERKEVRAATGGIGNAKTGGNYAASLHSYKRTLDEGCDQTMWLDSKEHAYVEEMSGMNFFAVMDGILKTPPLSDSILEGITRRSLMELALKRKWTVVEERIHIDELISKVKSGECSEAFVCGTASVLVPIASFKFDDGSTYHMKEPEGKLSLELKEELVNAQAGRGEAPEGWVHFTPNIEF
ncbi:MAG: branched-chain amino acid aminotransferase [Bacteriovoracaceae bacterium]|nr:branched-chain amino acid aminotransferase [Bacteriovoracaceae bacterium]